MRRAYSRLSIAILKIILIIIKKKAKIQVYYYALDLITKNNFLYFRDILFINEVYLIIKEYFKYNINI